MKRGCLGERGVALALVLWLVVILGAIAVAVVGSTRQTSTIVLNARARTAGRYAAESGIVAGVAALEQSWKNAYTGRQQALALGAAGPELARLRDVSLGDARFAVAVTNLNGRLDLNQADPEVLVGLLSQFTSQRVARSVVAALQDWRDPDDLIRPDGAEKETYRRAGSPYVPRNAPLTRLDEFRRLRGVTDSLALAVEPYLTVNGDERIDVNAAPEPVLAALARIGPRGARTLVSRRREQTPFTSVRQVQSLLGPATVASRTPLAVAPSRLLLISRGWLPGNPLTHEIQAAYAVLGQRLVLKSWRERDL